MLKHEKVKQYVIDYISEMKPNQKFLSRQAMCRKWDISRSTADKVVKNMVEGGWLYTIKGSGTYISPQKPIYNNRRLDKKIYTWTVLMPDVRYSIYPEMFKGIEKFAKEHNVDIIICNTDDDAQREFAYIKRMVSAKVDGFLIVPARFSMYSMRNYQYLKDRNIPFVFWNRSFDYMPEVPQICLNGYHGGYIATRYLLKMGYKRIAYMALTRFRSSMDRFFGYCSALNDVGIPYKQDLACIELPSDDFESIKTITKKMLQMPNPPDAFLCFIDKLAVPISQAIKESNLRISDDVGLIGFESSIKWTDNNMDEKLTCVVISSHESGYSAGKILYEIMKNEFGMSNTLLVHHPQLLIRETCRGFKNKNKGGDFN
ncbi:TPA: substrate-binding domain-containing protein [bacterium]|nr:substrate-binding domain-containing protein [bacterium]